MQNIRDKIRAISETYFPYFYSFFRDWYWKSREVKVCLLGTKVAEKKWANRSLSEIKAAFNNITHPHRLFLLEKITAFQPISNVLEVGCGYGANLHLLSKRFPEVKLTGIDINSLSVQEGKKLLREEGISNVKLLVGKADELYRFQDKSFDIVFTDALLIYIGPDQIETVIEGMLRIARRALILVEWHENFEGRLSQSLGVYHFGCWKRDYINLLKQSIPSEHIRLSKIPRGIWPAKHWEELGFIVEAIIK